MCWLMSMRRRVFFYPDTQLWIFLIQKWIPQTNCKWFSFVAWHIQFTKMYNITIREVLWIFVFWIHCWLSDVLFYLHFPGLCIIDTGQGYRINALFVVWRMVNLCIVTNGNCCLSKDFLLSGSWHWLSYSTRSDSHLWVQARKHCFLDSLSSWSSGRLHYARSSRITIYGIY